MSVFVSCVDSAVDTATRDFEAKDIIECIRTDKHFKLCEPIENIRSTFRSLLATPGNNGKAAKAAVAEKKKKLPGVLWSGRFRSRKKDDVLQHSGLLCADLDGLGDRIAEVRAKLLTSPHLWALFISPTGDGLKSVFRVPPDADEHKASFRAVEEHVRALTGDQIDQSCSDVARLCFLSHDPEAYLNEDAVELPTLRDAETAEKAPHAPAREEKIQTRRRIATELLGEIDWSTETNGHCTCPAQHLHTTADAPRDCKVYLDTTPNVSCFHSHCHGILDGVNHELRSRIGKAECSLKPEPLVCPLLKLAPASADDATTLLGNRFLCRAGGLLFVGQSGIGKSTAVVQAGICWAVDRECFGIRPRQPLKILYVQAENDEGDLCEMRDGVLGHLELTREERNRLDDNFTCVFESSRAGRELIEKLDALLEKYSPDLLILDPALSYIGGNANEQETVGGFLRNHLNPLLQKHSCGVLIVHHTNKPNAERDGKKKVANDFAYAGTGSAEWANWARAVLVLQAKNDEGLRLLQIGKRFRLNWVDADGEPTSTKWLKQSAPGVGLFYSELTAEESLLVCSKTEPLTKVLHAPGILPETGGEVSKEILIARITQNKICGRDRARSEIIPSLVDEGYLEKKEVPRHKARPAIHFVRTKKIVGRISFVRSGGVSSD
jgi:hypothetical protein